MTPTSPAPGTPARALIYSRISSDQTGEGRSNERQEQECQRLIDYKRWELVRVERDVSISAYSGKIRPGWERVLEAVAAGDVDVIVAYHLDRLTRSMSDLERLILLCEEHGVSVATATGDIDLTNDTGRMVARILAAVARQEVERKAARQRLAHAQRRAEGKPWRAVKAFGYTRDGEVVEEEAAAIRQAASDFLAGATLTDIARRWDSLGLSNSYNVGKTWTLSGVRTVLSNPRYAGHMTHGKKVVGRGDWASILDGKVHTLIRAKLADPSRKRGTSTTGRKASNLLTGIARCATCGDTLRAGTNRGAPAYTCNNWHVSVDRALADGIASTSFAAYEPELAGVAAAGEVSDLMTGIANLSAQLETLSLSFARQGITIDQLEAASDEIREEIATLEEQIEHAAGPESVSEEEWVRGIFRFAESGDLDAKRSLLARHAVVTVHPKGRGRSALEPWQQVTVEARGHGEGLRTLYDLRQTRPRDGRGIVTES